ncbi:MAG: ABC transporter substrate-binding protein [Clostridia bacterium]|nr:ABC transporter substrate-binding protein [Clostridia bacterium]
MKKCMKKLICAFLSALIVCAMAGCGGDSDAGKRIVKWEVLRAGFGTAPYEALAKEFMKQHKEITVKIVFNPTINETTSAKLEAGQNLSDVYSCNNIASIRRWALKGWLEPIDDVYAYQLASGKTIKDSLTGNAAAICSYKNVAYTIPEYTSLTGFVYNKSLFDKYGWKVPTNTFELNNLCKKILKDTNDKVSPIVYCGGAADGYLYFGAENWVYSYEGIAGLDEFYSYKNSDVFNPANFKGKSYALQNLKKFLFDEGRYTMVGSSGMNHIVAQSKLINGEAAMMLNGSWFENEMADVLKEKKDVQLGMFPVPETADSTGKVLHSAKYSTEGNKQVIQADYGSYYFIPTKAQHKEDAKLFLEFLSEQSSCETYTKLTNAIRPFDYELDSSSEVYADMTAFGKSILDMAKNNYLYTANPTSEIATKGVVGFWANGGTPYVKVRDGGNISTLLSEEYEYAKSNWNKFLNQVK